MGYTV